MQVVSFYASSARLNYSTGFSASPASRWQIVGHLYIHDVQVIPELTLLFSLSLCVSVPLPLPLIFSLSLFPWACFTDYSALYTGITWLWTAAALIPLSGISSRHNGEWAMYLIINLNDQIFSSFLAAPWHMEFQGQRADPSCSCDLCCSYGNAGSFNLLLWVRDWTCDLVL